MSISYWRSDVCASDLPESQQYCTLGSRQYACGTNVSIRRGPRDCRVRRVRMGGLWWLAECSGGVCGSRVLDAALPLPGQQFVQTVLRVSGDAGRSDARRVGKEWVSTSRFRWSP